MHLANKQHDGTTRLNSTILHCFKPKKVLTTQLSVPTSTLVLEHQSSVASFVGFVHSSHAVKPSSVDGILSDMTAKSDLSLCIALTLAQLGAVVLVLIWTGKYLNGFKLAPVAKNEANTNDTGKHKASARCLTCNGCIELCADVDFRIVNRRACTMHTCRAAIQLAPGSHDFGFSSPHE